MPRNAELWSVIDRGSGYWYYKLEGWKNYRTTKIRVRYNAKHKPTNEKEAERFAVDQAERARLTRRDAPILAVYLIPFYGPDCPRCQRLATDGRPLSEEYRNGQRSRINRFVLNDPVADTRVDRVTPGDIEDMKTRLAEKKVGARTINQVLSALSGAFTEGVHRGDLIYNPVASVGSVRVKTAEERGIFTPAELKTMFVERPEVWGYNTTWYRGELDWHPAHLFGLLIATIGERPSAVLHLDWKHYDDGTLTFPRAKDPRKAGRVVPVIGMVSESIEAWREDRVRIAADDPIFGYDDGGRMGTTWFRKRFGHMMATLELPKQDRYGGVRVPYSLKYTLETELIDRGANPALVRDLMGHSHQRGAPETVLTPVQARYRRQRAEKLRELLPLIEAMFD